MSTLGMDKFIIEYSLGACAPFLERNIIKKPRNHLKYEYMSPRACSSIFLLELISLNNTSLPTNLYIKGYQENFNTRYNNIEINLKIENGHVQKFAESKINTFSCYDITTLHIIAKYENQIKFFYSQFSGCHTTRNGKVLLHEIKLFDTKSFIKVKERPTLEFKIKTINLKSKNEYANLHYMWNDVFTEKPINSCKIELLGVNYTLNHLQCIFCMKFFNNIENLQKHLNSMHLYYFSDLLNDKNGKILKIMRKKDENSVDISLSSLNNSFFNRITKNVNFNPSQNFSFRSKKKTHLFQNAQNQISFVSAINRVKEFDETSNFDAKEFRYSYAWKINEIIDVNEKRIDLMIKWNDFILIKKIKGRMPSKISLIREFVNQIIDEKEYILELLILFYQKGILLKSDVTQMVHELAAKQKNYK